MAKTVVRVQEPTPKRLRSRAAAQSRSAPMSVGPAADDRERKLFWEQVNQEFQLLRRDPAAWKHELEERAAWDATLCDGRQ
jgi:hypothetical protein